MSIIIAIKDENKVYFAADSQVTMGSLKINNIDSSPKCIKTKSGIIIGTSGKLIDHQILITLPIFKDTLELSNLSHAFIMKEIVNPWFSLIQSFSYDDEQDFFRTNSSVLLGFKSQLFLIQSDGGIVSVDNAFAIGSGSDIAYPFIIEKSVPPKDRIQAALNAAELYDLYVSRPFIYLTTDCEASL